MGNLAVAHFKPNLISKARNGLPVYVGAVRQAALKVELLGKPGDIEISDANASALEVRALGNFYHKNNCEPSTSNIFE